ncbi:Ankyrin repeat and SAM domain-containing protein 3, partial [Armadillidium nasatum]
MNSLEESYFSASFYGFNFACSDDELFFNSEPQISQDIFTAAHVGNKEVVHSLISNEPYLANAKNKENWNAIMYATYYNHQEIVLFLLEKKAPLHACNGKGQNVLMIASSMGYDTLVEQFLNLGSNIECRDGKDWTPLLYAVDNEFMKVVEVLLNYGANPNAMVRNTGKTPLIIAAYNGNCQLVKMLLSSGAYLDFKDCLGKDALSYAIEIGHKD